jgi:hypothetical protein
MATASPGSDETILARETGPTPGGSGWGLPRLVLFRFAVLYFVIYSFPFPLNVIPGAEWPVGKIDAAMRIPVVWFADVFLGITITIFPNGSGDTTFNYVQVLLFAIVSVVGALVWTVVGKHNHDPVLRDRFHIYLRYVLGYTMISYGLAKVLTTQFAPPGPDRLATTFGEFSPMGLLWSFMGYSTAYCVFTGAAEAIGGVLLFWRRTTTLGALIVIGVMVNVVMLNFCYDVPVKLYSSHLLVMAIVLTLPDVRRLLDVLVFHRPTAPNLPRAPFRWRRLEGARRLVKTVFLVGTLAWWSHDQYKSWREMGTAAPEPPLYGHYEVTAFYRGGVLQPAVEADGTQWKRVGVGRRRRFRIWTMQGPSTRYMTEVDEAKKTLALTGTTTTSEPTWTLEYSTPAADQLVLEGTFNAIPIEVHLKKLDTSKSELMTRGFRWINEYPHNQ